MDYSMPSFSVFYYLLNLLKFMSIESVMPSKHLILCCPFFSCPQSFPASGSFPMSQFYVSGGQNIGASVSASVLPKNIQDWFLLGLTGLISLVYIPCYSSSTKPLPDGLESVGILHVAVCLHMLEVPTSHPMPWSSQLIMLAGEKWDWLSTLGTVECSIQTGFKHSQAAKMKCE